MTNRETLIEEYGDIGYEAMARMISRTDIDACAKCTELWETCDVKDNSECVSHIVEWLKQEKSK